MTTIRNTIAGVAGLCAVALAATLAPPVAVAAPGGTDRPAELLGSEPDSARRAMPEGAVRARPTTLDDAALDAARAGDRLTLRLFDDVAVTALVARRTSADGVTTWTGGLEGEDGSFTAVEVGGFHHVTVTSAEDGTYEVTSSPGGDYVVTEPAAAPTGGKDVVALEGAGDEAAGHAHHRAPADTTGTTGAAAPAGDTVVTAEDAATTIDIAIVYPAALVSQLGEGPMQAQFAQGIAQANQAFAASGIGTQLRLVGTRQVAAPQLSSAQANLAALRDKNDGLFNEADALREETHADLVSFWMAGTDPANATCGIGYLGGLNPGRDSEVAAYTSLYVTNCATANLTFAHEVGHNLSADHDAGARNPAYSGGKPYARGLVDLEARTQTVMAYPDQCYTAGFDCAILLNYSNPAVAVNGRPTGTASAFNAQAINEQIAETANFRQSQIYPGAVSITGRPRFKGTAEAASTPWTPAVTLSYQWSLDGVAVPGATASTFKLSRRDIGKTLTLQVLGSAPYYPAVAAPAASVVVGKALFRTKRPKLRGVPRAGRVLSVKVKGWKPKPAKKSVKVRYQWLKNGKKIKGAKKATYRVRAKDRGKKISVRVTAKKKGYEKARRTSKKVKIRR